LMIQIPANWCKSTKNEVFSCLDKGHHIRFAITCVVESRTIKTISTSSRK
jgi:hypothetical protein